ncbi:serine/threonine-protein kinase GL21140 isoform X1 [Anopheles funestus]|uniref:serine/threonine-protein kinase GL21140 isoform X1 n=1 Tax=Anopheles funestus TaxID=62324 RepID=UPI0020C73B43|nr:serine/threonine-protein kinase GL21140 isoform X1 [Anopheles funestus]
MEVSTHTTSTLSRSNSRTSSNSELEKELIDLDISGGGNNKSNTLKKRISSSRTPAKKAKRIRFFRNGDKFYPGSTIPVSVERYRSFDSLTEDLTRLLEDSVTLTGAIRAIYTLEGKKIEKVDDLEDGKCYVCSCNNEGFKRIDYNVSNTNTKNPNRLSRIIRPLSPVKNGGTNGSTPLKEIDSVVHPRIVTLIRNGVKPRKIMRLLLNKRNSPTYEHVLTAITQCVKLDTGCVRKVFTVSGIPVQRLAQFFDEDDVFFAYGNERVGLNDFELEAEESKAIAAHRKTLRSSTTRTGPKPKMPVKSHNDTFVCVDESALNGGILPDSLPLELQAKYTLGSIIGDGNFAVVLKLKDKQKNTEHALKIIDKSKCSGKDHYLAAEIRVMKKLNHPYIIQLVHDIETIKNMYLVLELVRGGDLFDAITRVTRFSENQSKIMMKHLASAMAYMHSLSIVHRDIKPENLLVELDNDGNVVLLKLGDFGLACEVTEPLLSICGTPTYVAPEILMESGYGVKIDVWAAGIILYILLCGFPPFVSPDNQQEQLFDAILNGFFDFPAPYWNNIGDSVRDLIINMLQSDPELRFSSEDILDHPWLTSDIVDDTRDPNGIVLEAKCDDPLESLVGIPISTQ